MQVNFIDENSEKRNKLISKILPDKTIIETVLEPQIEKVLFGTIADCIRQELEIYRRFPKRTEEKKAEMIKTFNPTNNETCFMGKGFKANNHVTDSDLYLYRNKIGKVNHPIWGDVTLMEIWGGDHFEEHNEMVVNAFKYGMNIIDECPEIKVFVNPLFQNKKSKNLKLSTAQQEYKDEMDMLLAKAMIFGVKDVKQAKRDRRRR